MCSETERDQRQRDMRDMNHSLSNAFKGHCRALCVLRVKLCCVLWYVMRQEDLANQKIRDK